MIHYIFQLLAFQLLFLLVYDLFLKKETFFQYNRIYLICTSILSLVLPLLQIGALRQAIPQQFLVQMPTVFIGEASSSEMLARESLLSSQSIFSMPSLLESLPFVWIAGMLVSTVVLVHKLYIILKLKRTGRASKIEGISLVMLPNTDMAFSFFNTMYIGEALTTSQKSAIVLHEQVHVKQRHTLDLLFFEVFKIVCWFNPLVYLYQKRMEVLHEYIADQSVAAKTQNTSYYQTLLSQVFKTESIAFINTFFNHSLIKKRIIMLQKSKSNSLSQLKYLVLVPLVFSMLVYTSCSNEADQAANETANLTTDSEVMEKIVELSEAIMKKGNISDEELKALKFLAIETKPGDKIYMSVQEYLDDPNSTYNDYEMQKIDEDIPFAVIDKVPVYPGCGTLTENEQLKKCMSAALRSRIGEEFDVSVADNLGLTGAQQIYVQFKIDKRGNVTNIQARAPHEDLKAEAVRVLSDLPQMTPGQHEGKAVGVLYSLPIQFQINE